MVDIPGISSPVPAILLPLTGRFPFPAEDPAGSVSGFLQTLREQVYLTQCVQHSKPSSKMARSQYFFYFFFYFFSLLSDILVPTFTYFQWVANDSLLPFFLRFLQTSTRVGRLLALQIPLQSTLASLLEQEILGVSPCETTLQARYFLVMLMATYSYVCYRRQRLFSSSTSLLYDSFYKLAFGGWASSHTLRSTNDVFRYSPLCLHQSWGYPKASSLRPMTTSYYYNYIRYYKFLYILLQL